MARTEKNHYHFYEQHPNQKWATHAACTVCGFALSKNELRRCVGPYKTITPDQVSDGLRSELGL